MCDPQPLATADAADGRPRHRLHVVPHACSMFRSTDTCDSSWKVNDGRCYVACLPRLESPLDRERTFGPRPRPSTRSSRRFRWNCSAASSDQRLKNDTLRHLSRGLLVLQNLIECPANDVVAFARRCFQPPAVDDLDSPASIFYEVLRLQRPCDQCYARSAQSQHIG
jgi:hypothetical protein